MSIPFIFGWGKNSKEVGYIGIHKCPICNNFANFTINEVANNVRVYFIPVAKFNRKRYLVCGRCNNGWELEEDRFNSLMYESMKSFSQDITLTMWKEISDVVTYCINNELEDYSEHFQPIIRKYGNSEYVIEHINRMLDHFIGNEVEG